MTKTIGTPAEAELFDQLKDVRARAIEHAQIARQLAAERRELMERLIAGGFNQSDLARELGVSRQAVQKMLRL